ncbi:MAG: hypothetical protein ACM31C_32855 [Acidobacteriota bacterium]
MRVVWIACLLAGCAAEAPAADAPPLPIDTVWAASLHAGDLIALVPGTGAYDFLAATIEPLGPDPVVDVRAIAKVADDAIVFEQAIAAAHRAGISDADLEAGAVTFGLWGAGFTSQGGFEYVSYEGLRIHVAILGGENTCATGLVLENLVNYTSGNARRDATDLYARVQAWLAAHPSPGAPRDVIVASHSWGGAVAEYLARELPSIEAAGGPLADGGGVAPMRFTIAAGVPAMIANYALAGPGLRDVSEGRLYEVDRPDDPVHALDPSGNPNGHQYDIVVGDTFLGSYGVTTTELACAGVPGPCGAH